MTQAAQRSSRYLAMPDGVELAVDIWRADADAAPGPVLMLSTRYWRALDLVDGDPACQAIHGLARFFTQAGYTVVNIDARGSGASLGTRSSEWSNAELHDLYTVVDWIAGQPWCNGSVAAHGYSYGGNTAFLAAAAGHPALRVITPQFADIDPYAHNLAPGGVLNRWLRGAWGQLTAALDRGDVAAVAACLPGVDIAQFVAAVRGPSPVDGDAERVQLRRALAEHRDNFNMGQALPDDFCADDAQRVSQRCFDVASLGIAGRRAAVEASRVPILYWAGWFDAGTAQGALELFRDFDCPMRVVIGPWNHGRRHLQDPLGSEVPHALAPEENYIDLRKAMDDCLVASPVGKRLDFFTLGRNTWHSTEVWPLPQTRSETWWLNGGHGLSRQPEARAQQVRYHVSALASTGVNNRWHTQIGCKPVHHEDRRDADARLLVFDSAPLIEPLELTGTPVAHLLLACDQPDAHLFVYLEVVLPGGTVRLLSEGCLRLVHRAEPRSFSRGALMPMPDAASVRVTVPLLPLSIELPAGVRLRLAIAGADADTFVAPALPPATFTLQLGGEGASRISLPVFPRLSQPTGPVMQETTRHSDLSSLTAKIGQHLGPSRWFPVTQELINQFGQSTLDNDPMHLDVEWSKEHTPFGGTVAAGFWTTSMLIPMSHDIGFIDEATRELGAVYALNYGFNNHRLITPVPVGSSVRAQMALKNVTERTDGNVLIAIDVSVEIEGHSQPALVAEWLALLVKYPKVA